MGSWWSPRAAVQSTGQKAMSHTREPHSNNHPGHSATTNTLSSTHILPPDVSALLLWNHLGKRTTEHCTKIIIQLLKYNVLWVLAHYSKCSKMTNCVEDHFKVKNSSQSLCYWLTVEWVQNNTTVEWLQNNTAHSLVTSRKASLLKHFKNTCKRYSSSLKEGLCKWLLSVSCSYFQIS